MTPEIASHGRTHERVWIMTVARSCARTIFWVIHRCVHCAGLACSSLGKNICVVAGARFVILDLRVFAIRHLWEEDACVPLRIECLFLLGYLHFRLIIRAWSWILAWWVLLVLDFNGRLKDLTLVFRGLKVTDRGPGLHRMHVRVVKSRSNSVKTSTRVHVHIHFLWRDGSRFGSQLIDLISVPIGEIFAAGLVQVRRMAHEFKTGHVATWIRISQVCRWFVDARAWSGWAETRNLI